MTGPAEREEHESHPNVFPGLILVVEDEAVVAEVVAQYLQREGYAVETAHDGPSAIALLERCDPALVILDVMLPGGIDGFELCRRLRADSRSAVILLTARTDEVDKLVGLGLGADDYMTKPFSPRELVARVKAVLRRASGAPQSAPRDDLSFGSLRINARTRTVRNADGPVDLTAREFDLLHFLASHPGQVFTRDQLLDSVWHYDFPGEHSTVTVHVRRVRAKIEDDPSRPRYVKTVWGVGYKFDG
jgi:DNA-binding response OmpR family regulator